MCVRLIVSLSLCARTHTCVCVYVWCVCVVCVCVCVCVVCVCVCMCVCVYVCALITYYNIYILYIINTNRERPAGKRRWGRGGGGGFAILGCMWECGNVCVVCVIGKEFS